MSRTSYPSDLTDAQSRLIRPLAPAAKSGGRPRGHGLRAVVNAPFHLNREGRTRRAPPHDFPPWRTAHDYFAARRDGGARGAVNGAPRRRPRVASGRPHTPTTASIDSRAVKAADAADGRGYDGARKLTGRKRRIVVDSPGPLPAVPVTAADVQDAAAARRAPAPLTHERFPRLKAVRADGACGRYGLPARVAGLDHFLPEPVRRPLAAVGFVLPPRRRVVERTFARPGRHRRHSRDYERRTDSSGAMIRIGMIHRMARRLEPGPIARRSHYRRQRKRRAA